MEEDEEHVFHPNREEEEIEGWEDFATFEYGLECFMVPQLTRKAVEAMRGMYLRISKSFCRKDLPFIRLSGSSLTLPI